MNTIRFYRRLLNSIRRDSSFSSRHPSSRCHCLRFIKLKSKLVSVWRGSLNSFFAITSSLGLVGVEHENFLSHQTRRGDKFRWENLSIVLAEIAPKIFSNATQQRRLLSLGVWNAENVEHLSDVCTNVLDEATPIVTEKFSVHKPSCGGSLSSSL